MAAQSASPSDETIAGGVQKAIVSAVRLSSAFALYGVDTLQAAASVRGTEGFPRAMDNFGEVLDRMAGTLTDSMGDSNRESVEKAANMADEVFQQSCETLSFLDPRRLVQLANDVVRRSAEMVSNSPGQAAAPKQDEPELAADVLSSPI